MNILDKYAKTTKEKRTERIQTKLTPTEYHLYMKYLKDRGLSASEATRYLILEEIGLGRPELPPPENIKGVQKEPEKGPDDKPQYAQWRVNGAMPCPLCGTWQKNIAAHLKAAHKTTKQRIFSDPKFARIASEMVKEKGPSK